MQTFLPYADFAESAACLDRQRLGKQRVECVQILRALSGLSTGWRNHPATAMWAAHVPALVRYSLAICNEWHQRGYQDTCADSIMKAWMAYGREHGIPLALFSSSENPYWLTPEFCRAHQSNLIRKNPEHYGPMFPGVPDNLPYIWPV